MNGVVVAVVGGILAGGALVLTCYLLMARPLIQALERMRYRGFASDLPMPAPPKTVPFPPVRED